MSKSAKKEIRRGPPVIENRRARHNYEIMETVEAGIALLGTEVKSLREGRANLQDAYAVPMQNELVLLNCHIQPYSHGNAFNHEETRSRKLLLKRREINSLASKVKEKQLTLVPLKMYFNDRGKVKVLLGLGRGKKLHDKRESEKKNEARKEIDRAMKDHSRN
ncbi:MAG: SsrA-binding protein SmpB [Leptospiraceae bacterium]|nr:SsrA-binding protein SmpB [Leptospiraceae bacterium]